MTAQGVEGSKPSTKEAKINADSHAKQIEVERGRKGWVARQTEGLTKARSCGMQRRALAN